MSAVLEDHQKKCDDMVYYYAIVFELKSDDPTKKKLVKTLLKAKTEEFISRVRTSDELKIYFKEGKKL